MYIKPKRTTTTFREKGIIRNKAKIPKNTNKLLIQSIIQYQRLIVKQRKTRIYENH